MRGVRFDRNGQMNQADIARVARNVCYTLWGKPQQQAKVRGLNMWWYSTAGHGGFVVAKWLDDSTIKLPKDYKPFLSFTVNGRTFGWFAFEEDCEYAIPIYCNPDKKEQMLTLGFGKKYLAGLLEKKGQTMGEWLDEHWNMVVESMKQCNAQYM